jgi:hypothetical protein
MRNLKSAAWVWVALLLIASVPAWAEGTINKVGQFSNNGISAEIDTFTEGAVVVAVIAFKSGDQSRTFAFDRNDWPALERLWASAMSKQGSEYTSVGSQAEVGTSEKCVLLAAAGPGVRLTIASPLTGAMVFDIPSSMVADFDTKLRQVASLTTAS